jgi:hypothetical protein
MAVFMKHAVFWDVTACSSRSRRFGGSLVLTRATRRNIPDDEIRLFDLTNNVVSIKQACSHIYESNYRFLCSVYCT